MTWFFVDDSFPQHPKLLRIPRTKRLACAGLWTLAGAWCAKNLTDGCLDAAIVGELGGTRAQAAELVRVGLWEHTDDGFLFHDWTGDDGWQKSRAEVLARREAEARRKQAWRDRKKHDPPDGDVPPGHPADETRDTRVRPGGSPAGVRATPPHPTPPSSKEEEPTAPRKRGRRIPDDFTATDDMRQWAVDNGFAHLDLDRITVEFRDYWAAESGQRSVKLDWVKTWRNRIRAVAERAPSNVRSIRPPGPDGRLSPAQVTEILGQDRWVDPKPPAGMDVDEGWEWQRQQRIAHLAEREAEARARLGVGA